MVTTVGIPDFRTPGTSKSRILLTVTIHGSIHPSIHPSIQLISYIISLSFRPLLRLFTGTGLYDNLQKYSLPYPEAIFEVGFYRKRPQAFVALANELWPGITHSPTRTHSFLKLLSDKGLLLRNYTQNIDGLENLAGLPIEKLVECHGHFRTASCIECHKAADAAAVRSTIVTRKEVPLCKTCGGHVKPDIVFFGEQLPHRFHQLIHGDVKKADCILILGTSLQVAPVSSIPQMVNCPRVVFNREPVLSSSITKNKSNNKKIKDIYVEGDCDDAVEQLCELLGWREQLTIQNAKTRTGPKNEHAYDEGSKM